MPTFNSQPPVNQTDHPKNPDISIGALLRSQTTDEATTSANHQRLTTGTDLTDCEVAFTGSGSLEAPPSTTGTNSVAAKEVELVALGTATEPGEPCTGSMNRNGVTGIYEPEEQRMFDVGYIDPGEDYWRLQVFGSDLPPTREEVRAEIIAKAKEIAAAPIPDDIEPWEPWERDDGCDHDAPPLTISVEPHASKRRQPTLKQSLKMEINMRKLRRHLSNQGICRTRSHQ